MGYPEDASLGVGHTDEGQGARREPSMRRPSVAPVLAAPVLAATPTSM